MKRIKLIAGLLALFVFANCALMVPLLQIAEAERPPVEEAQSPEAAIEQASDKMQNDHKIEGLSYIVTDEKGNILAVEKNVTSMDFMRGLDLGSGRFILTVF